MVLLLPPYRYPVPCDQIRSHLLLCELGFLVGRVTSAFFLLGGGCALWWWWFLRRWEGEGEGGSDVYLTWALVLVMVIRWVIT